MTWCDWGAQGESGEFDKAKRTENLYSSQAHCVLNPQVLVKILIIKRHKRKYVRIPHLPKADHSLVLDVITVLARSRRQTDLKKTPSVVEVITDQLIWKLKQSSVNNNIVFMQRNKWRKIVLFAPTHKELLLKITFFFSFLSYE